MCSGQRRSVIDGMGFQHKSVSLLDDDLFVVQPKGSFNNVLSIKLMKIYEIFLFQNL